MILINQNASFLLPVANTTNTPFQETGEFFEFLQIFIVSAINNILKCDMSWAVTTPTVFY